MRKILLLFCAAPLALMLILWLGSFFYTLNVSFGLRPYSYSFEFLRGTVEINRVYDCPTWTPPHFTVAASSVFDEEFYDNGSERYGDQQRIHGIYSCSISAVIGDGTTALDPDLLVTPVDVLAIPYRLLLAGAALPLLAFSAGILVLRIYHGRHRRFIGVTAAIALASVVGMFWVHVQNTAESNQMLANTSLWRAQEIQRAADPIITDCNEILNYEPDNINARTRLDTTIHTSAPVVIADCTRALELDPENPTAFALRGRARKELGEYAGAFADLNHALEYGPYFYWIYLDRAEVEKAQGNLAVATTDFAKARDLKFDPTAGFAESEPPARPSLPPPLPPIALFSLMPPLTPPPAP